MDQAAIIYGVGTNSLKLPLPPSLPNGFLLLMKMCCDPKPRNRPSFSSILLHLSIASTDLVLQDPVAYADQQLMWKRDIRCQLRQTLSSTSQSGSSNRNNDSTTDSGSGEDGRGRGRGNRNGRFRNRLDSSNNNRDAEAGSDPHSLKKIAEMKKAEDIRALYEEKLERVNHLYAEMASLKAILQEQAKNRASKYVIVIHSPFLFLYSCVLCRTRCDVVKRAIKV